MRYGLSLFVMLLSVQAAAQGAETRPISDLQQKALNLSFEPGEEVPFLGLFTHTEPHLGLAEKRESVQKVIDSNPLIVGFTLKVWWRDLHPERDRYDWEGLEALIDSAAAAGKLVNLAIIPGGASPEWIYDEGVRLIGPVTFGRTTMSVPLPWDPKFVALYQKAIEALAERYANDPRLTMLEVMGQNYNTLGEEMYGPPADVMKQYGWTREVVIDNWKHWIDQYNRLFPDKLLSLVISPMYEGAQDIPDIVTAYFLETCPDRGIMQSHQLHGAEDTIQFSGEIIKKYAHLAPASHELVGTFLQTPRRQGTPEMTVYNARQLGRVLYLQLWRRDSNEPTFARALLDAWNAYAHLSAEEMKAKLIEDGKYIEDAPPEVRGNEPVKTPVPGPRRQQLESGLTPGTL